MSGQRVIRESCRGVIQKRKFGQVSLFFVFKASVLYTGNADRPETVYSVVHQTYYVVVRCGQRTGVLVAW